MVSFGVLRRPFSLILTVRTVDCGDKYPYVSETLRKVLDSLAPGAVGLAVEGDVPFSTEEI